MELIVELIELSEEVVDFCFKVIVGFGVEAEYWSDEATALIFNAVGEDFAFVGERCFGDDAEFSDLSWLNERAGG